MQIEMRLCLLAASIANISALLVAPLQVQYAPAAAAMQMSLSRRALLSTVPLAAMPLSAHAALVNDYDELKKDTDAIKRTDAELAKERKLAFEDEIALERAQDDYVEALKKNDNKAADAIATKIKALKADYAKQESQVVALTAEETKEVAAEKTLQAKVKVDEADELQLEDKELMAEEVAALKTNVDTSGFLSKFFGSN